MAEGREGGFIPPQELPEKETSVESSRDIAPSSEEVWEVIEPLVGEEYTETKRDVDDDGLKKLVVEVKSETGEVKEYTYDRKAAIGSKSGSLKSSVSVTFYDADGMPEGGKVIADFENGAWKQQ